jgi:hypothetical protein
MYACGLQYTCENTTDNAGTAFLNFMSKYIFVSYHMLQNFLLIFIYVHNKWKDNILT